MSAVLQQTQEPASCSACMHIAVTASYYGTGQLLSSAQGLKPNAYPSCLLKSAITGLAFSMLSAVSHSLETRLRAQIRQSWPFRIAGSAAAVVISGMQHCRLRRMCRLQKGQNDVSSCHGCFKACVQWWRRKAPPYCHKCAWSYRAQHMTVIAWRQLPWLLAPQLCALQCCLLWGTRLA